MDKLKEENNEENDKTYIAQSRDNIDTYLNKKEYRKAFGLLILVLERLDDGNQKNEFIDYYSKNMKILGILNNDFPSR